MKIDCFIMNPPYGSYRDTICLRIFEKMKNKTAIIIAPPPTIFHKLYFQMTEIESVDFPRNRLWYSYSFNKQQ